MKRVSIAIVALASSAGAAVAGDIAAGETSFKKCMPCHSIGENAKNMIGPIQNGLKGRKSGTVAGFNYSDANKNSGIVWDEGTFKEYIKDPKAKIPGTKMVFPGLRTRRKPKICGASSSSSDRTARRNEQFSSRFNLIIESVVDRIEVDDHCRCSKVRLVSESAGR